MCWQDVLPSNIFNFSLFILISYLSVYQNHKHVQNCSPTNITFFPNLLFDLSVYLLLLLYLPGKEVVVLGFQNWTCLWFSWTGEHKINKNREKPKTNFQEILCFMTYLLCELTQRAPKQHSHNQYTITEHVDFAVQYHENYNKINIYHSPSQFSL